MTFRPRAPAAIVISSAALFSTACTGEIADGGPNDQLSGGGMGSVATAGSGATPSGLGGSTTAGGATSVPGGGNSSAVGGTQSSGTAGAGTAGTGTAGSPSSTPLSTGGVTLRRLTQTEYVASLKSLFGNLTTPLDLPEDTSIGGFIALGASKVSVNPTVVDAYEVASRAVAAEVFGDTARWQTLVGCMPQANLSDACVDTFVRTFGKKVFRRALTDAEAEKWVKVGRDAAALAGTAAHGLSTITSGFLQSPNFLYRVERTELDQVNDRLRYDGRSMADRLAFFLTGGPPSAELLGLAESGKLDTVEGVRSAATSMLSDATLVARLTAFFYEWAQADLVMTAEKSPEHYPNFDDKLKTSMREGTRLFLEKVVLGPGADVRSLFDSDQVFADALLAPIYGVTAPASGFAQFTTPKEHGRAGIMGQAAMLAAHSKPDHSSPTARGVFMLTAFLCTTPPPPPMGVITDLVIDPTLTTRQRIELHRKEPLCANCHALFDPMGMSLEHFDSIGRYRATEDGLTIDASGVFLDGKTAFNGAAELGAVLRNTPQTTDCLLRNFYRNVNGRDDDTFDKSQIDGMVASLASRGYVFRDLVTDFVVSEAFRSAPRVPITGDM